MKFCFPFFSSGILVHLGFRFALSVVHLGLDSPETCPARINIQDPASLLYSSSSGSGSSAVRLWQGKNDKALKEVEDEDEEEQQDDMK